MQIDPNQKLCTRCLGTRFIQRVDIQKASTVRETCPDCKGMGIEYDTKNGVFVKVMDAIPMDITLKVNDDIVCRAFVLAEEIIKTETNEKWMTMALSYIRTKKMHRNRGYASQLLDKIKVFGGGVVKYIWTSWDDSSDLGRKLMMKNGFKKISTSLLWRRDG
jgi:hypothetical protein